MSQKIGIQNIYPLTPLQEGILFHHLMDASSNAYIEQLVLSIKGRFHIDHLKEAYQRIIDRHDVFRTVFRSKKLAKPLQVVLKTRKAKIHFEDITSRDIVNKELFLEHYRELEVEKGFDLTKDQLFRITVLKVADDEYKLLFTFHHIILDGWSVAIVLEELMEVYHSIPLEKEISIDPVYPYSSYISWAENQNMSDASIYWNQYIREYEEPITIPKLSNKKTSSSYEAEDFVFDFGQEITSSLRDLAKRQKVTLNTVVQSLWGLLVHWYSQSEDIMFGSVVSGRPADLPGIEKAVGMYINTVPVRMKINKDLTFSSLIESVQNLGLQSKPYEYYPLYLIENKLNSNQPLIDHVLAFENYPLNQKSFEKRNNSSFVVENIQFYDQTHYDLNVIVFPEDSLRVRISFNSAVFDVGFIQGIKQHLVELAKKVCESPNEKLRGLSPLSNDEKAIILKHGNAEMAQYPSEYTIHEIFEICSEKYPSKTALKYGVQHVTYEELNSKSNRLAAVLRQKGLHRGDIVAIMADRTPEMIIGILATLKAGGTYLPVDPTLPFDRIHYMLSDSKAKFMLGQNDEIKEYSGIFISFKDIQLQNIPSTNLKNVNEPTDTAYIIYTSGTTGRPKGVMVDHKNVIRLLHNSDIQFQFDSGDIWTLFHSFSFDFSVWEMYGALLYGGTCVIVPKEIAQNPKAFLSLLQKEKVTVLNQTPSAFFHLIEEVYKKTNMTLNLRYVIFGGEALKPLILHEWKQRFPEICLVNMYGITETTVHVTYKEMNEYDIAQNISNIGKPIPTNTVYILNDQKELLPIGVPGELYVGGKGVSKGYLFQETLTKERFLENLFRPGELMYKTGDLVRMLPSGDLEYLGRIDHQVKVRGHRIELGEIENQLLSHSEIKEAVVINLKDHTDMTYLCAYVVSDRELSSTALRTYLSSFLPDYMIPAHFVFLASLPLTGNGKIDRKELPKPEISSNFAYVEPQTSLEIELAKIWKEVLGVERVGIHDHFFELGGHSLRATQLVNMIHKNLDLELPLKMVFEKPTIQLMCQEIEKLNPSEKREFHEIQKVEEQEYYPASSAQKRLLILNQLENIGNNYNITGAVQLEGPVDPKRLEQAIQQVINRHEALRTSFETTEEGFIQRVHPHVPFSLEQWEEKEPKASQSVNRFSRPFNLSNAPLLRAGLVKTGPECHVLILDMHHSISDEASLKTMLKEISLLYKGEVLPPLRLQYKDVAAWQTERMKTKEFLEAETFWLKEMSGELPVLDISRRERPKFQSFEGDRVDFHVPTSLAQQLSELATKTGTTLYMVLLSAYQLLLSRYSGQEDIIVGSPVASRPHADLQNMVGMFVNTIPMRNSLSEEESIRSLLQKVRERALLAFEHQSYPFEQLVEKVSITRDLSRNPVFDHMFIMHDAGTAKLELENVDITSYSLEDRSAKVDLTLEVSENEMGLSAWFQYSTALFSKDEMKIMSSHFVNILEEIVKDTDQPLSSIEMISEAERYTLLHDLNPKTVAGVERTVHQRFEEQVTHTPAQIAVISSGREYTYQEINERANRMARALQNMNVEKGDRIGVMVKRSEDLIIALLAVLKTGAAYVPIDPDYPEDRIAYMVHDSNTKYIMTDVREGRLSSFDEKLCLLSDLADQSEDGSNLEVDVLATELAYIIYTSGSTGKPKGVMVEHRSVHNFIEGMSECVKMASGDKVLALTTVSFDIFVTETFLPLAKGACVIMASEEEQQDPALLSSLIMDNEVTTIQATPSRIKGLLMYPEGEECLETVKVMIVGGEALPPTLLQSLQAYTNLTIYNAYGPSETSVWSTIKNVTSDHEVTIGQPIRNTRCYIVGPHNRFQPIGVLGELCIAGSGVSRGYLNRPELTASKFVEDPFMTGETMYKTGDLARWLPDGQIEYAGRIDQQVKMRGYRIELQEIEVCMEECNTIREAAVALHRDSLGDTYLCGYVVWNDPEKTISFKDLKVELAKRLPGYMVPTHFMVLEQLPLTANGKLDRKSMPKPEHRNDSYVEPQTQWEKQLTKLWSKVLGVQKVGVHDHFFSLGGQSLKAIKLINEINKLYNIEMTIKDLFLHPTVYGMSQMIEKQKKVDYVPIVPSKKADTYPMTSAQKRLFLLNEMEGVSVSYNMPTVLEVTGEFNIFMLQKAFTTLIDRHEILRTSFEIQHGEPVQRIHEQVYSEITVLKANQENLDVFIEASIQAFNLTTPPLIRMTVVEVVDKNKHFVILDMHHIISDGLSLEIIEAELLQLYQGRRLDKLDLQYKDFAVWQKTQLNKQRLKDQEMFWLEKFEKDAPLLELPLDYQRPKVKSFKGSRYHFNIDQEFTRQLNQLVNETDATLYMILLSCFQVTLSRYTGQEDIVVGTPVSGRNHPDVHNLVGMFVNMLPLRMCATGKKSFRDFLHEVKKITLESFTNQDYPFEELIGKLKLERDIGRNPLFDVVFALQNSSLSKMVLTNQVFSPYQVKESTSKFDLMLEAVEEEGVIQLNLQYCTDLFNEDTIIRFSKSFINIVKAVCKEHNRQICDLEILSEDEEKEILQLSKGPASHFYPELTIQEAFEIQVNTQPDKIAVISQGQPMTYKELNDKANRLAHFLKDKGVQEDESIGILMEQTEDMIVSILGVLKAGASYLPLNLEYPADRLKYLLEDSKTRFIIVDKSYEENLDFQGEFISVDTFPFFDWSGENLEVSNSPSNLAYIMYTSGTTGNPKGVMVTHRNVNSLVLHPNYVGFEETDQILLTGASSFDATTFEIWGALLNGLTVHLCERRLLFEINRLSDYIKQNNITIMWLTSSLFNQYAEHNDDMFAPLRYLIVGGEALSPKHISLARKNKKLNVINAYGPTENTTFSTYYPIHNDFTRNIPIGRPISNSSVFIVDSFNNLQPIGVAGEICVGGAGVARGYLNKQELTSKKFTQNPFGEDRIYHTGDIGRWLPDGNIEYIGRIDNQVKIRGYRIELKEIEAALLKHSSVRNGVVKVNEDINKQKCLCAYYVAEDQIEPSELRDELKKRLPSYMIPSFFIELNELPLTVNGKVDTQSLPNPDYDKRNDVTLPRNEMEEIMVEIFKEVLGVPNLGMNESFFDLGGDSIKALQISARLHSIQLKMEVKDLFKYPTIESIAPFIQKVINEEFQGAIEGEVQLTPIQKWFFEKLSMEHYWNQAIMLHHKGKFDEPTVRAVMRKLVEHHDALRMSYLHGNSITQVNRGTTFMDEELFHFDIYDYTNLKDYQYEISKKANSLYKGLNLQNGPLVSLGLFKTSEGDFLLFIVHHLVIDGVSWRILIEDFISGYQNMIQTKDLCMPKKTASYQSWSAFLSSYSKDTSLLKEIEYWEGIFKHNIPKIEKEFTETTNLSKHSRIVSVEFSKEETISLLNDVHHAFHTEKNDILLTALALSLKSWTGNSKFLVNLEGHGREAITSNINISRTIGWFTSIFPVLLDVTFSEEKSHLIKQVKEMMRGIPNKGIGFGILKYLSPFGEQIQFAAKSEPQISFNFLGEYGNELKKPFTLSSLPIGESINPESVRPHDIEILGKVVNGALQFQFEYNKLHFSNKTMERLARLFKSHLIDLIHLCTMKKESEYTPSDYGDNHNLTFDELENLQDLIAAKFKS
ncbi:non-ribosomal peptide synthetase [Cytobacillus dafuensis]|uniref:Amino acid adenylation domain-containing protein n=1 Tax=Cytobacillus dafuensis TaxID=1742359 RepID=A0A5B8Z6K5_CYTDA|nr:non-ribosomal peptide synthetase [Cytobacillus dafuensis]QED47026.1 amino acid adenylation domain-containing protein [Cytobacillus dafuensis]